VINASQAINIWLPTFTAIGPLIAEEFYRKAATFAAAFNTTYRSTHNIQFWGLWVNLADGNESLSALADAVQIAKHAGISLGAVMAVGTDPAQSYFQKNFDNFKALNALYGNVFTQMAFDVENILTKNNENASGIAGWLALYAGLIPPEVTLVAFTGGEGVQTVNINSFISNTKYPFAIVGIVELYSTDTDECLPSESGCQSLVPWDSVVMNWTTGSCSLDHEGMPIAKVLLGRQGSWAGLSVEGQECSGGCLISSVDSGHTCDAGGSLSFAQYSLDDFVNILTNFGNCSKASPLPPVTCTKASASAPMNIMLYESSFLPGPWLTSMNV